MTGLWKRTLASFGSDQFERERELLRSAFYLFRDRAKPLAEEIKRDLPDFTIHDVSHLDALWGYADLIAGKDYEINPCEAFVLGGAFLIHDLGMGLAAYPDGFDRYRNSDRWRDALARLSRQQAEKRGVSTKEIPVTDQMKHRATAEVLRQVHAERASQLALCAWSEASTGQQYHLIDNVELRMSLGPLIGRIAHSHWWSIDELPKQFPMKVGSPPGFPQEWSIDCLKLACLMRLADFSHLDSRRAPGYLKALGKPSDEAEIHWQFQGKLMQASVDSDRIVYTASSGFTMKESAAWWLCYDTLVSLDGELRGVDSLLADLKQQRFHVRGVSGADEPSRLANLISTDGWTPVDTRVRVSAVGSLVSQLGGEQLYGDPTTPPLRELLQNAFDAVRARRIVDNLEADWGEVIVRTGSADGQSWLEVEDCGVGMSARTLTGPFLDFGVSFWRSDLLHSELPGIDAAGFEPVGRYGIGFYSVFMWGDHVSVCTQKYDRARDEALVLEFRNGLKDRPLLRPAEPHERPRNAGTKIRVWFRKGESFESLFSKRHKEELLTLQQLCAELCPAASVTIKTQEDDGGIAVAVTANDWTTLPDEQFLRRMRKSYRRKADAVTAGRLKLLSDKEGRPIGRVAILIGSGYSGTVTVGGFASSNLDGITGILEGVSTTAARNSAVPITPVRVLRDWASQEWQEINSSNFSAEAKNYSAAIVRVLGGDVPGAPLAKSNEGWLDEVAIAEFSKNKDRIILGSELDLIGIEQYSIKLQLNDNVLISGFDRSVLQSYPSGRIWPFIEDDPEWSGHSRIARTLNGVTVSVVARAWNSSISAVLSSMEVQESFSEPFTFKIGVVGDPPKELLGRGVALNRPKKN